MAAPPTPHVAERDVKSYEKKGYVKFMKCPDCRGFLMIKRKYVTTWYGPRLV